MRSTGIPTAFVDGQELLLPDAETLAALERAPFLDDRPLGVGRIFARHRAIAARLPGIHVAIGESREPGKPWIVYHVHGAGEELVRVHLESQLCTACGESRVTALVRHFNLYEGTRDPWAALEAASLRPTVACPACRGAFPAPPYWAAPSSATVQPSAR